MKHITKLSIVAISLSLLLSACGQKGPLISKKRAKTPAAQTTPADTQEQPIVDDQLIIDSDVQKPTK